MACTKTINQKRKQLKTSLLLILFTIMGLAQDKQGYIDMHGGKTDSLSGKGGFSSNMNLTQNPFAKKTDDQHIPIEKIGTINEIKEQTKQKETNE